MKRISKAKLAKVREVVRQHGEAYQEQFGVGPCGALAIILKDAGWGQLAFAESNSVEHAHDDYKWYPHYVILDAKGNVLDVSGEYLVSAAPKAVYREIEKMDEPADPLWGDEDLNFWRTRLEGLI